MAYYLSFDGTDDYVSTSYHLDIDFTADSYEIEFELDFTGDKNGTICSQCITNETGLREFHLFIASSNFNVWFVSAGDVIDTGYRPTARELLVLAVNPSGGTWSLTSDGSPVGSGALSPVGATEPAATFLIGARHAGNLSSFAFFNKADLYRLKIRKGGALLHDYNPSASGGTGSTLPDVEGAQDGTLVNFPTNDSQWVFYQGPVVDADVNYTISAPTFTASADTSLPQPITDASFTISAPSFSANCSATLPQPIGDIAFTVNAPSVNADASATIPGFNASVSFTVNAPTFSASANVTLPSPTANVNYSIAAPTFNASATASLPQPIADVRYTIAAPQFSVDASATLTGYVADVAYTVLAPTFAVSAEATLPQPIADANFTIAAPTFSVVAIVGGIAIIVDEETNINQRVLSNNINAPILSNNING